MKNTVKLLMITALIFAIVFSAAACKGKSGGSSGADTSYTPDGSFSSEAPAASGNVISNPEMDKLLDEYEKIVDDMIPLFQNVMVGDMAAIAELENLQNKAEAIAKKYEGFTDADLSITQARRWAELSNKLQSSIGF